MEEIMLKKSITLFISIIILCTGCAQLADPDITDDSTTHIITDPGVMIKEITQYGITWTFDKAYPSGQFVNGDYWIVGPVKITAITNTYHTEEFTPVFGNDGSMINPGTDMYQGYEKGLSSYKAELNRSCPNGASISAENPLSLNANETIVSAVSWLYNSSSDTETGCPKFNGATNTPRPALRTAAVLTCLNALPLVNSFRPPYCGSDKSIKFTKNDLQLTALKNLSPNGITSIPDVAKTERNFQRVWLDHENNWMGEYIHPTDNMPKSYGQYMSQVIGDAALLINLDWSGFTGTPSKETLAILLTQLGIDLAGIADNNGNWPSNGGILMGRKFPILFAGLLLNDPHMKGIASWTTKFQEDDDTFYVSQTDIDITHSTLWKPDIRCEPLEYETEDIGKPEWGIRHTDNPYLDNNHWDATYRDINGSGYAGFILAAHIMDMKILWDHPVLFDYEDRWMELTGGTHGNQKITPFTKSMWLTNRGNYPPVWTN
jgi:hypothetical protein